MTIALIVQTVELRDKASFGSHPLDESRQNTVDKVGKGPFTSTQLGAMDTGEHHTII